CVCLSVCMPVRLHQLRPRSDPPQSGRRQVPSLSGRVDNEHQIRSEITSGQLSDSLLSVHPCIDSLRARERESGGERERERERGGGGGKGEWERERGTEREREREGGG